jgi:hypothetical protein
MDSQSFKNPLGLHQPIVAIVFHVQEVFFSPFLSQFSVPQSFKPVTATPKNMEIALGFSLKLRF